MANFFLVGGVDKSMIKGDVNYIALADPEEGSQRNWDVCIKDADFEGDLSIKQKDNAIAAITTSTNYITMPSDQGKSFIHFYCLYVLIFIPIFSRSVPEEVLPQVLSNHTDLRH